MRNKRTYEIAMISVFVALVVAFAMIPQVGYITIGVIALTTVHIPVLIGGTFGGRKVAYALALTFGLSSLWYSFIAPSGINIAFQNPLVSVLPRVLFGLAFVEIYELSKKLIKNRYLAVSVHMIISTIVHTLLVTFALVLFGLPSLVAEGWPTEIIPLFIGLFTVNGVFEALAAGLIAAPIARRLLDYKEATDLE
jgi:uncharacterized membrane protein